MAVLKEPGGAVANTDHFFESGDLAQALQQINRSSVSIRSVMVFISICVS